MKEKARQTTEKGTRTIRPKSADQIRTASATATSGVRTATEDESGVPPVVVPKAILEIDIRIPDSAPYFKDNGGPDRADFEAKVYAELSAKVATTVWTTWQSISLAQTHPTEAQVQDAINWALNANNTDPNKKTTFYLTSGGSGPSPTHVRYVWRDGKFVRVHSYALDEGTQGNNWILIHEPPSGAPPVTVHLEAQLSWVTEA